MITVDLTNSEHRMIIRALNARLRMYEHKLSQIIVTDSQKAKDIQAAQVKMTSIIQKFYESAQKEDDYICI